MGCSPSDLLLASGIPNNRSAIGVSITAGQTALTLIPLFADLERGRLGQSQHAVLAGGVGRCPSLPIKPATEELLTMAPPRPCFSICCISNFRQSHVPLRLMSIGSVPVFLALLDDRNPVALDAGVIEGVIQSAKSLDSSFRSRL